jgi:hypothetical protein
MLPEIRINLSRWFGCDYRLRPGEARGERLIAAKIAAPQQTLRSHGIPVFLKGIVLDASYN